MAITQKEIAALIPCGKRVQRGCGDGLILVMEPAAKGGGKSFLGRTRILLNGKTKQVPVRIGVFGSKAGQYTLKDAREKWQEIKRWSIREGRDPREYGKPSSVSIAPKTLQDAVDGFLVERALKLQEVTLRNYRLQLQNQVLTVIDGSTPLKDLEWDHGGRQRVMELKSGIESRGSYDQANRVQKVLSQCFEYAIVNGWMNRNQNPATKYKAEEAKHNPSHHPTIPWSDVPDLLEKVSLNPCSANIQTVLAVKLMLMTFLRAGALVRLEWSWIDTTDNVIVIPGATSGLKRTFKTRDLPHHVPITAEIKKILDYAKRLNGKNRYVFTAIKRGRYQHLCPEAPNNFLKNLGYRDVLRAHGWRSVPLTVGQEVLKTSHEIIQRQMGHLIGDKVRKAYDKSIMLEERRQFLERWCDLLVENGLKI